MVLNIAYSGHKNQCKKNIQYKVEREYCKCLREDRSGTYQLGRGVSVFCEYFLPFMCSNNECITVLTVFNHTSRLRLHTDRYPVGKQAC